MNVVSWKSVKGILVAGAFLGGVLSGTSAFAAQRICDNNLHTIEACYNLMSGEYPSVWNTTISGIQYRIDLRNVSGNSVQVQNLTNGNTFNLNGSIYHGMSTNYSGQFIQQSDDFRFYLYAVDGSPINIKTGYQRSNRKSKLFCVNGQGSACTWTYY